MGDQGLESAVDAHFLSMVHRVVNFVHPFLYQSPFPVGVAHGFLVQALHNEAMFQEVYELEGVAATGTQNFV